MRPLRALVIYIAVVFLGGALLAPWLHWLLKTFAGHFPGLAEVPFHRVVNRSMTILALAGLWPLLRALGARSARDLGLVKPSGQSGKLFAGFLLGFVSLGVLAGVVLICGARTFHNNLTVAKLAERILSGAFTAVAVGVIEEILFRGGIFGGLRRVLDWRLALFISSAIFAIVHFLARTADPETVTWTSGFGQLGLMLGGFLDSQKLVPGFFNLTLIGVLLGLAYQRTGNLYFSIGLHVGWIFWLRCYGTLTTATQSNEWLWGSNLMVDGWLAFLILVFAYFALRRFLPAQSTVNSA